MLQTMSRRAARNFHLVFALIVVAVVVYGFSHTIGDALIHPTEPRPPILYVHAAVFTSWLVLFVVQSALVRVGRVRWHRLLGRVGIGLGAVMPALGVATALAMGRFNIEVLHSPAIDEERTLVIPLFDMICFATAFALAVRWRRTPDRHRRSMLIATAALTAAGWGRFPDSVVPYHLFYAGVDLLILLGVARDLLVERRVHEVYRYALPALIAGQTAVMYIVFERVEWWRRVAEALIG